MVELVHGRDPMKVTSITGLKPVSHVLHGTAGRLFSLSNRIFFLVYS